MRKEHIAVIRFEGRDKGKIFHLKEMASTKGEKWALRALFALGKANVELPPGYDMNDGWAALALVGFKGLLSIDFEEAEPLLDEMMECVRFQPDPKKPEIIRGLVEGDEGDIEEIATRLYLRAEVFALHAGFSLPASLSISDLFKRRKAGTSPNTPTSQEQSEPSSQAA